MITCDGFIQETKIVPAKFNEWEGAFKTQNFCILLAFFLIANALLIAVSIYCSLIECPAKQKHLLPFHFKNNKLREVLY